MDTETYKYFDVINAEWKPLPTPTTVVTLPSDILEGIPALRDMTVVYHPAVSGDGYMITHVGTGAKLIQRNRETLDDCLNEFRCRIHNTKIDNDKFLSTISRMYDTISALNNEGK